MMYQGWGGNIELIHKWNESGLVEGSVEKLTPFSMFIFIDKAEDIASSSTIPTEICQVLLMDKTELSGPLKRTFVVFI